MLEYNMGDEHLNTVFTYTTVKNDRPHPFQIELCGHFFSNQTYFTERSGLNECLMIYTVAGEGSMEYNNVKTTLTANSIVTINCNQYHLYKTNNCDVWEFYWIHFSGDYSFIYTDRLNKDSLKKLPMDQHEFFHYFNQFTSASSTYSPIGGLEVSLLFCRIFVDFFALEYVEVAENQSHFIEMKQIAKYIEQHIENASSIDELAKKCNLNKFHFIKLFTRIVGTTPHQYLLQSRVKKSKELLLLDPDLTINEIALQTGFCDAKNFITNFKKKVGTTPSRFRKNYHIQRTT